LTLSNQAWVTSVTKSTSETNAAPAVEVTEAVISLFGVEITPSVTLTTGAAFVSVVRLVTDVTFHWDGKSE
jgi:hypothetical protein